MISVGKVDELVLPRTSCSHMVLTLRIASLPFAVHCVYILSSDIRSWISDCTRLLNQAIVTCFKVRSYLAGQTDENHENSVRIPYDVNGTLRG
jgi:hypothetical protein